MAATDVLRYRGTEIEVRLGDHVTIRSFFGRTTSGIVSYLPGESTPHPQMESDDERQWAITLENGKSLILGYFPDEVFAPKRVRFLRRGPVKIDALPGADEF